jgi:hypothetical protein
MKEALMGARCQVLLMVLISWSLAGCGKPTEIEINKGSFTTLTLPSEYRVSEVREFDTVTVYSIEGRSDRQLAIFLEPEEGDELESYIRAFRLASSWDRKRTVGDCTWNWQTKDSPPEESGFDAFLVTEGYEVLLVGSGKWPIQKIEEVFVAIERSIGCVP